jgi:hypothetical protein
VITLILTVCLLKDEVVKDVNLSDDIKVYASPRIATRLAVFQLSFLTSLHHSSHLFPHVPHLLSTVLYL